MYRALPATVVVIVTNAASFAFIAANRVGEPDAVVTVTERELRLAHTSERDSAQRLELDVRTGNRWPNQPDAGELAWLTVENLTALGFDCQPPRNSTELSWFRSCGLPRRAFVTVEYDGPVWSRVADALRRARDKTLESAPTDHDAAATARGIDHQIKYGSRLTVVDASVDAASLRRLYPDPHRFVILPARISAWMNVDRRTDPKAKANVGADVRLLTATLVTPVRYRDLFLKLGPSPYGGLENVPRYSVSLAVGRRHEPWIQSVDPIDSPSPH